MPPGYSMEWTGLYQYAEDARSKLRVVVPDHAGHHVRAAVDGVQVCRRQLLIMLSAPFALVGGIFLQWALGYSMTTAVIIGYVSLFAVAIQTGIIMIEFIREALAQQDGGAVVHGRRRRRVGRRGCGPS